MKTEELKCGIQPFWFWNGDMDKEEILYQIRQMKEQGITGFIIHPRQGMKLPYMSETYFERLDIALDEAQKLDMEVWLYDEYPYPSGITAGQVTLTHPEYQCKMLHKTEYSAAGGESVFLTLPWGQVLSAMAYPVQEETVQWQEGMDISEYVGTAYGEEIFQFSGLTKYNHKRFFTGKQERRLLWEAPKGQWKIYVFMEVVMTGFKYFDTFIDTLNPEAVKCFLYTTHERYKERLKGRLGTTIKGIFTDEITAFPPERPWSPLLPDMIQKKTGINILEYLPVLFGIPMDDMTDRVLYAYWNTCTEAFIEAYDKQVYDWCKKNHIRYIGEKPIMRSGQLQYMHVPGIDAGHQKVGEVPSLTPGKYRANGKILSSSAHLYDRDGALCEAFHSIGWGMTLQDMKWTFDWLTAVGVDWFVIHAFYYTTNGLRKHDAPPSAFYQMPWWQHMKQLSIYAKKLNEMNRTLKRCVNILLVDPVTTVWTAKDSEKEKWQEHFSVLQRVLLEQRFDYYVIDPQLLEKGTVEKREGETNLAIHGEYFSCIILPSMTNLEDRCFDKIREFAEQGGLIAAEGHLADQRIMEEDPGPWMRNWFDGSRDRAVYGENPKELCCKLKKLLNPYEIIAEGEEQAETLRDILSVEYETDDGKKQYFLVNTGVKKHKIRGSMIEGILILRPLESRFLGTDSRGKILIEPQKREGVKLELDGEWKMDLESMNVLRLGYWNLWAEGTKERSRQPVEPMALIDQLEKGRLLIPVNPRKQFGCPKTLLLTDDIYHYDAEFWIDEGILGKIDISLVMEQGGILGEYKILINGYELKPENLKKRAYFMRDNLAAEITAYLSEGKNKIEVVLKAARTFDGVVSPLYLMGAFGVMEREEGWHLRGLPCCGNIKDKKQSLIPFYGGSVCYTKTLHLSGQEKSIFVEDVWLQDCAELFLNGRSMGVKAWAPYEWDILEETQKKGENQITLKITGAMEGLFEGQYFDREHMVYVNYQGKENEIEEYEAIVHK